MNIHASKMAGPWLPPRRFCGGVGRGGLFVPSSSSTFPLANFDFLCGKQASPKNFCLAAHLVLPSHFAQPLHTKRVLCLTRLPSLPQSSQNSPRRDFSASQKLFISPHPTPQSPPFIFIYVQQKTWRLMHN